MDLHVILTTEARDDKICYLVNFCTLIKRLERTTTKHTCFSLLFHGPTTMRIPCFLSHFLTQTCFYLRITIVATKNIIVS